MKKIMFNDRYGLTQAVLEGRKTMTRRIVPKCKELDILRIWEHNEGAIATGYEGNTHSFRFDYCPDKKRRTSIDHLNLIPSYKVGEVVAVAQSYKDAGILYDEHTDEILEGCAGWTNKMFVTGYNMPNRIRITSVSIERLHDISDEECVREGMSFVNGRFYVGFLKATGQRIWLDGDTPREAFAALIDKVSGKGTWARNPWVYVYEFELVR